MKHSDVVAISEQVARNAIARLEDSILHHEIERDGWHPQDECYQKKVEESVREIVTHVLKVFRGQEVVMPEPWIPVSGRALEKEK